MDASCARIVTRWAGRAWEEPRRSLKLPRKASLASPEEVDAKLFRCASIASSSNLYLCVRGELRRIKLGAPSRTVARRRSGRPCLAKGELV